MKGFAHKYGDHIDTDVIIPARYLNSTEPEVPAMPQTVASFAENGMLSKRGRVRAAPRPAAS